MKHQITMKRRICSGVVSVLLLGMAAKRVFADDNEKVIYVIRHGEKTYDYNDPNTQIFGCLSQMGWARAYNLVSLFGVEGGGFPTPDAIFSAQYDSKIYLDDPNDTKIMRKAKKALRKVLAKASEKFDQPQLQGNCRDANGWYRTQQTVSAVAAYLNIDVNNQTGFLPRFCFDKTPGLLSCRPYQSDPPDNPAGLCCNPWSATQMILELNKPEIKNILVAWEHKNIEFLAQGLAGFPEETGPAIDGVRRKVVGTWPDNDYDIIYEFHYSCNSNSCEFQNLVNTTVQGFKWLGPKYGSGFSVPDISKDELAKKKINAEWIENECVKGSSCPICPKSSVSSKQKKHSKSKSLKKKTKKSKK